MPLADYRLPLDLTLFQLVNRDGGATLDAVMRALSAPLFGIACGVALAAGLAASLGRRAAAPIAALVLAVAASDFLGWHLLKPLFARARPCYVLPAGTFRWVGAAANVGSLPSLHAANMFALALIAALARPRLAPLAYAAAVAVSLSRVYLGVHWPSDVAAGAAWGTLCAGCAWGVAAAWRRRASRDPA